jgi:hypothetical protein
MHLGRWCMEVKFHEEFFGDSPRAPTHGKTNSTCCSLEIHGRWIPIAMKWWNGK